MKRTTLKILQVILTIMMLSTISLLLGVSGGTVSAASAPQQGYRSCSERVQNVLPDSPVAPDLISPAGVTLRDANWTIVSQETYIQKDDSGQDITTTITIRRNPQSNPPVISDSPASPLSPYYCSSDYTDRNRTISTSTADGGVTQYLKDYYRRYVYTNGSYSAWAYHTYETDIWWTRINSSYTLGQNTTTWTYSGTDCYASPQNYPNYSRFTPTWSGNSTPTYMWTFMNLWSTLTPNLNQALYTEATTNAYHNGVIINPSLYTKISLTPTGP